MTARRIVLSPRAADRLVAIAAWTSDRFGDAQAERYNAVLRERLDRVADGTAHLRPLAGFTGRAHHRGLHLARAGEHFLVLELTEDRIRVLDIPHVRSNPLAFLNDGRG